MVPRFQFAAAEVALVLLLLDQPRHSGSSGVNTRQCASLAAPSMQELETTLRAKTEQLATLYNMSFTVGLATCDDQDFAFASGLDDRFTGTR